LAAANGAVHVYDLTHRSGTPGPLDRGPSLADVLRDVGGVATSIAGIGLLGLGIVLVRRRWVERRSRPASLWRRSARAVAALAIVLVCLVLVVFPVVLGTVQTHRLQHTARGPVPA